MIDLSVMRAQHRKFSGDVARAVAQITAEAAQNAEQIAKNLIRPHNRTGKLFRATRGRVVAIPRGKEVRLENNAAYAEYFESGTGAHEIPARRRRFLRFVIGGTVFYRRRVFHKGSRAFLVFSTARDRAFADGGKDLKTRIEALARTF